MIPVKLEMQNFLAYRQPAPLDLTGLHVACLTGANGAGKSALLDAITWALWGEARARRDDDLIYSGETDMQVRLTFLLEGNCFRVTRYRTRQGRGSSTLQLEVQDGDDWRPITESSIRATQDKIIRLLRLDYQTFINSAFLVQGRADEFTNKTPGERKAVLGRILGLDAWSGYEERAKQHLRGIDEACSRIDAEIERIEDELGHEPEYMRNLIEAQRMLADSVEQVRQAEERVRILKDARNEQDRLRDQRNQLDQRIHQTHTALSRIETDYREYERRLAEHQQILAARAEIEAGYAALLAARQQERDYSARLLEHSDLRDRQFSLQQTIAVARSELETEHQTLARRRKALTDLLSSHGEEQQALAEAEAKIARLETRENDRNMWREQLAALREERAMLEANTQALRADRDRLKKQRDQILAATEPICPLCEQELSEEHRAELLDRLERDSNRAGDAWRANRERLEALSAEITRLSREIEEADTELRNLPPLRKHVAQLTERLAQAQANQEELAAVEMRLSEIETALSTGNYVPEAQAELADVQARLAAIGYDEQTHQAIRAQITEYEPFEARRFELDSAAKAAPEVEASLARLTEQYNELQEQLAEDTSAIEALDLRIGDLDQQLGALEQAEQELANLRDAEGQANVRVGAAQQKLNILDQQRQRREKLLQDRDQMVGERGIYEELRAAFSKDGIPAMIIEAAIPEIEQEANQILARMTDGRMHVRFETQREKVTGGVRETLDIRIADELGTRDYETFSGGEAFRVNFAVRLALSRLLAHRAGAQLRTLIIDEGFGTQDAQGRERLVQAINAIEDEFDLILVITHLDELRDAFPVHIEVTKTRDGSLIRLV